MALKILPIPLGGKSWPKKAERSRNQKRLQRLLQLDRELRSKGYKTIAGVDEAGRGPLAGPVVSAAVCLLQTDFTSVIADSKLLSNKQRQEAYIEILRKAYIGIGIAAEGRIDADNIHRATLYSMKKAVNNLIVKPDCIIVDGPYAPKFDFEIPAFPIVSGDNRSCSIACASIIAKVTRDWIMDHYDKVFPSYGFSKNKGYGTPFHLSSIKNLGLSSIHRKTFIIKSLAASYVVPVKLVP